MAYIHRPIAEIMHTPHYSHLKEANGCLCNFNFNIIIENLMRNTTQSKIVNKHGFSEIIHNPTNITL